MFYVSILSSFLPYVPLLLHKKMNQKRVHKNQNTVISSVTAIIYVPNFGSSYTYFVNLIYILKLQPVNEICEHTIYEAKLYTLIKTIARKI